MKKLLPLLFIIHTAAAEPERLNLWPDGAPLADGKTEAVEVPVFVHRPEKPNGTALVICPGGGYGGLVKKGEGSGIAAWLNQHGITGIVLHYRLPKGRSEVPLSDALQAIRLTRTHAKAWGIDPKRVGIVGFSAGGHLAASACTLFTEDARPDFGILVYPVISMGKYGHGGSRQRLLGKQPDAKLLERFSLEKQVIAQTPPVYLAHAVDDKPVPVENSRLFHAALEKHGVKGRLLELPAGGHGLNGYKGPHWDAWQAGSLEWLRGLKLLP